MPRGTVLTNVKHPDLKSRQLDNTAIKTPNQTQKNEKDTNILDYLAQELSVHTGYAKFREQKGHRLSNKETVQYWTFLADVLSQYVGTHHNSQVSSIHRSTVLDTTYRRLSASTYKKHFILAKLF